MYFLPPVLYTLACSVYLRLFSILISADRIEGLLIFFKTSPYVKLPWDVPKYTTENDTRLHERRPFPVDGFETQTSALQVWCVYHSTTLPLYHSTTPPLYHSTTVAMWLEILMWQRKILAIQPAFMLITIVWRKYNFESKLNLQMPFTSSAVVQQSFLCCIPTPFVSETINVE